MNVVMVEVNTPFFFRFQSQSSFCDVTCSQNHAGLLFFDHGGVGWGRVGQGAVVG
jgi:hypothetical protein